MISGTLNGDDFKETVMKSPLAGNVDNPEGGLDALLQVMVCKNRIGWRNNSRKIILVATNQDYHNAMDGKLAGILFPNDGKCHLDRDGYYTEFKDQDYPSVSQINFIAQQVSKIRLKVILHVNDLLIILGETFNHFCYCTRVQDHLQSIVKPSL